MIPDSTAGLLEGSLIQLPRDWRGGGGKMATVTLTRSAHQQTT